MNQGGDQADMLDGPDRPSLLDLYREGVHEIYADLAADIAQAGPVCELSGRCCRFEEYGHRLFLATPEAELLLRDAPPPVRPLDGGQTCPWQDPLGRCTAREARPLGCRVYFCDPTYQDRCYELSEMYISHLKRLSERLGLPWGYAPLHHHLRRALEEGRAPGLDAPPK
ncbi:MAG: hypothetical protein U0835_14270 [Isosphaeraceae bacterium]